MAALGDILYCFVVLFIIRAPWWWFILMPIVIVIGGIICAACIATLKSFSFYVKKGGAFADVVNSAIEIVKGALNNG